MSPRTTICTLRFFGTVDGTVRIKNAAKAAMLASTPRTTKRTIVARLNRVARTCSLSNLPDLKSCDGGLMPRSDIVRGTKLELSLVAVDSSRSGACRFTKVPCIGQGVLGGPGLWYKVLTASAAATAGCPRLPPLSKVTTRSWLAPIDSRHAN